MFGFVVVKPKGRTVPSAAQDAATLKAEEKRDAAEVKAVLHKRIPPNQVSLGLSAANGVNVLAMFPAVLHVKRGTTVKFFMPRGSREDHTATFGPKSYLKPLAMAFGGPVPPQQAIYPSDPPGHIVLRPASHGNGYANVGVLDQDASTPLKSSGTIKFTKPGTYHFICLIHSFMHGTVVVK
jgi:plastocyanin